MPCRDNVEDTARRTVPWHPEYAVNGVRVTLDGTHFVVDGEPFFVPAVGAHFATNALAVIAVARHLGLTDEAIRTGLATAEASNMRMQKRQIGGVTLLNDAYNANPTSVRAALDTLRQIDWPGRKVVVLGEMKELGDHSAASHAAIAEATCGGQAEGGGVQRFGGGQVGNVDVDQQVHRRSLASAVQMFRASCSARPV